MNANQIVNEILRRSAEVDLEDIQGLLEPEELEFLGSSD